MTDYPPPSYPQQQPSGYGQPGYRQPKGPGSPWWRSWWAVGILALLTGLGIGGASASGSKKSAAPAPTVTATATITATDTVTQPAGTVTARPVITRVVQTKTRTRTETYTPPPLPTFSDGTYQAGTDIKPGRYHTDGGDGCYYEVDRNLNGDLDDIVVNDNISGAAYVSVKTGQYLKVSGGCDWSKA